MLVGFYLKNTISEYGYVSRGVCTVNSSGNLEGIKERTHITKDDSGKIQFEDETGKVELSPDQVVSMNLMGFTPAAFDIMKDEFQKFMKERGHELKSEFYIPTVLDKVANLKKVPVLETPEKWLGVTYKEDKSFVSERLGTLIEEGIYPKKLW